MLQRLQLNSDLSTTYSAHDKLHYLQAYMRTQ